MRENGSSDSIYRVSALARKTCSARLGTARDSQGQLGELPKVRKLPFGTATQVYRIHTGGTSHGLG